MFNLLPSKSPLEFIGDSLYRWRGIALWPEAEGTVYSCEWVPDQENGGGWYNIVFTYWTNGEIQQGSFRNFGPEAESPYFRGDTFTVRYNPKHPSRFYDANESSRGGVLLLIVTIGVAVASVIFALFH